jgi:hypothetical protein
MEESHDMDVKIHQLEPSPSGKYLSLGLCPRQFCQRGNIDRFRVRVEQDKEKHKHADSSAPLFTMYSQMAEKEDKEMAERWRKDADGILIFVSYSALLPSHFTRYVKNDRLVYSLLQLRY